jgi:hypothetical protein
VEQFGETGKEVELSEAKSKGAITFNTVDGYPVIPTRSLSVTLEDSKTALRTFVTQTYRMCLDVSIKHN